MTTYPFLDVNTISVDSGNYFWWGGYVIIIFDVTTTSPLAVTIILVDCDHCFLVWPHMMIWPWRLCSDSYVSNLFTHGQCNLLYMFELSKSFSVGSLFGDRASHVLVLPQGQSGSTQCFSNYSWVLKPWECPPPVRCIQLFELGSEAALPDSEHTSCTLCSWTELVVCIPISKTYIPWQGPPQGPAPVVS